MKKTKRTMSKEARENISKGMKLRWKKINGRMAPPFTNSSKRERNEWTERDNAIAHAERRARKERESSDTIIDSIKKSVSLSLERLYIKLPDIVGSAILDAIADLASNPEFAKAISEVAKKINK
jgi:hypothetical protein